MPPRPPTNDLRASDFLDANCKQQVKDVLTTYLRDRIIFVTSNPQVGVDLSDQTDPDNASLDTDDQNPWDDVFPPYDDNHINPENYEDYVGNNPTVDQAVVDANVEIAAERLSIKILEIAKNTFYQTAAGAGAISLISDFVRNDNYRQFFTSRISQFGIPANSADNPDLTRRIGKERTTYQGVLYRISGNWQPTLAESRQNPTEEWLTDTSDLGTELLASIGNRPRMGILGTGAATDVTNPTPAPLFLENEYQFISFGGIAVTSLFAELVTRYGAGGSGVFFNPLNTPDNQYYGTELCDLYTALNLPAGNPNKLYDFPNCARKTTWFVLNNDEYNLMYLSEDDIDQCSVNQKDAAGNYIASPITNGFRFPIHCEYYEEIYDEAGWEYCPFFFDAGDPLTFGRMITSNTNHKFLFGQFAPLNKKVIAEICLVIYMALLRDAVINTTWRATTRMIMDNALVDSLQDALNTAIQAGEEVWADLSQVNPRIIANSLEGLSEARTSAALALNDVSRGGSALLEFIYPQSFKDLIQPIYDKISYARDAFVAGMRTGLFSLTDSGTVVISDIANRNAAQREEGETAGGGIITPASLQHRESVNRLAHMMGVWWESLFPLRYRPRQEDGVRRLEEEDVEEAILFRRYLKRAETCEISNDRDTLGLWVNKDTGELCGDLEDDAYDIDFCWLNTNETDCFGNGCYWEDGKCGGVVPYNCARHNGDYQACVEQSKRPQGDYECCYNMFDDECVPTAEAKPKWDFFVPNNTVSPTLHYSHDDIKGLGLCTMPGGGQTCDLIPTKERCEEHDLCYWNTNVGAPYCRANTSSCDLTTTFDHPIQDSCFQILKGAAPPQWWFDKNRTSLPTLNDAAAAGRDCAFFLNRPHYFADGYTIESEEGIPKEMVPPNNKLSAQQIYRYANCLNQNFIDYCNLPEDANSDGKPDCFGPNEINFSLETNPNYCKFFNEQTCKESDMCCWSGDTCKITNYVEDDKQRAYYYDKQTEEWINANVPKRAGTESPRLGFDYGWRHKGGKIYRGPLTGYCTDDAVNSNFPEMNCRVTYNTLDECRTALLGQSGSPFPYDPTQEIGSSSAEDIDRSPYKNWPCYGPDKIRLKNTGDLNALESPGAILMEEDDSDGATDKWVDARCIVNDRFSQQQLNDFRTQYKKQLPQPDAPPPPPPPPPPPDAPDPCAGLPWQYDCSVHNNDSTNCISSSCGYCEWVDDTCLNKFR